MPNQQSDLSIRFDWNLIQSFLAVIDTGSLQAAGRQLNHSQPTIGRHVEQLENQLQLVLFERTGRALMPTDAARQLVSVARAMQSSADNVCRLVQSKDSELTGVVRIGASRMVSAHLLADIIGRIQQTTPEIDITVVSTDVVSNLLQRDADIAIRMVKPQQSSLIAKRIGSITILPCASQRYIDRRGTPTSMEDLFNHRLVGPEKDPAMLAAFAGLAQHFGKTVSDLRVAYRCDDFVAQTAAVRAGLGVGFVAQFVVQKHNDLVVLPFDMPTPALPLWLAVHREIRTTPRIRLVFDELSKHLKARLWT